MSMCLGLSSPPLPEGTKSSIAAPVTSSKRSTLLLVRSQTYTSALAYGSEALITIPSKVAMRRWRFRLRSSRRGLQNRIGVRCMDTLLLMVGLHMDEGILFGAQTERQGDAGSVRVGLYAGHAPAALLWLVPRN